MSVFGVLTIFRGAGVTCTSTMKHEHSICHPQNVDDLSVFMCENYIDGNLPEDQELDGNVRNVPRLILA